MGESLIVSKNLKEAVKAEGLNTAQSVTIKLDERIRNIIKNGCERAKANARKTLMEQDI